VGLRQHRDGRWDWLEAPAKRGSPPEPRFQHTAVFAQSQMLIIGGRGSDVAKALPTVLYDTETCEWRALPSVSRFRHSCWFAPGAVLVYGGFDHKCPSAPTNDLQVIDLAKENDPGPEVNGQQEQQPPPQRPLARPSLSQLPDDDGIKFAPQVFVSMEKDYTHFVRKVGIETLEDEGRKMNPQNIMAGVKADGNEGLHTYVIEQLLQPNNWNPGPEDRFLLNRQEVAELFDQALGAFQQQPVVLRLRAPIKVYGDIHGQFLDLMRLFARYKSPSEGEGGDIDAVDYLFLGDYVDRGAWSLEVTCLLFALKLKYPNQIHLIRGNHEDATINAIYGFREECERRLGEDPDEPGSCWERANLIFQWMPLAATIENQILCLHGGLGGTIHSVDDIAAIERPLHVAQVPHTHKEQQVTDLLWSDPTDADHIQGVTANETRDPDGSGRIVKFGPDRVNSFLHANPPLKMIVRAHECVMDGFERFADGKLITLFSATDYCGHHKNAGALLFIRKDLTIQPKLIYPQDRAMSTWDASITNNRPPTPPRPVPRGRRNEMMDGTE